MADNLRDLALIVKSRFPLVQIETSEEVRMIQLLKRAANLESWPLFVWSIADGIRRVPRTDVISDTYEFQAATSNDVSGLPPELLRKGRMDEIFFVDLPDRAVREEIFRIHLIKRKLDPVQFDLTQLAQSADGFSGAEIEQTVVAAIYEALAEKKSSTTAHLLKEISRTRPLSMVMAEKVEGLRAWAAQRTVKAD